MTSLSAGALSVRYSKWNDRLSHTLGIIDHESYFPLLESIEGSAEALWPVSPPMQHMVEESFRPGASPVLLGVGLSGSGHWSTAIESRQARMLRFDIACKNAKSATWLGSQYRVLTDVMPALVQSSSGPNAIEFLVGNGAHRPIQKRWRLEIGSSIGALEYSDTDRRIMVVPTSDPASIQTHRWCYEISLVHVD